MAESNGSFRTGLDEPGPRITAGSVAPGDLTVPLIVQSAAATSARQPVTVGVPFPRGVLKDGASLSIVDSAGKPVHLQFKPLARWFDGSVKWMLLDFVVGPLVAGGSVWSLQVHHREPPAVGLSGNSFEVTETDRAIVVQHGTVKFTLDRRILAPLAQVEIENTPVLDAAHTQTVLVDAKGRICHPRIERYELEAIGPMRTTVLFEGTIKGSRFHRFRFQARLSFFSGLALVRIELTLHNPRRARHRGGLWDLGDPGSLFFRDLSLQLALAGPGTRQVQWTETLDDHPKSAIGERFEIYQDSSGGENWQSRNHVNYLGRVPSRFRGYCVRSDGIESYSLRASPVVSLCGVEQRITAAIPDFWQQFPKAMNVHDGRLNVRLFPCQYDDLYELQGGEQKTHTVWFHFGCGDHPGVESLSWVHRPVRAHCTPDWYTRTEVIPHLCPASTDPEDRFESYLAPVLDGPTSLSARREIIDEYGWRDYGEIYADHEAAYFKGEKPVISHYNNQYDMIYGFLIQYFRTGDPRWFDLAEPLARHVIDIDIYRTVCDKAAYSGGLFWHTDHYRDAATCTHRAYSAANRSDRRSSYGGGPSSEHNYTTGLLHYYYLTGNLGARLAVSSLANWVISMDDGKKNALGIIDSGPTGLASRTYQSDYHGPGRGCGNSVNALLDAWLLLGEHKYKNKAEELIRRSINPRDRIEELGLSNPDQRWSYTVFLMALLRFLQIKEEEKEEDLAYTYALASLLSYAEWMSKNEWYYLDHPEKLEYPTETWAAQEFRKANVMILSAIYAEESTRQRLLCKATDLVERSWKDLAASESSRATRVIALMLREGWQFGSPPRSLPRSVHRLPRNTEFGHPLAFVPQKRRVINRILEVINRVTLRLRPNHS